LIRKREIERDHGLASFDETFSSAIERLPRFVEDGMVVADESEIRVTTMGRIFIRNVAMLFDSYLEKSAPDKPQIFSRTLRWPCAAAPSASSPADRRSARGCRASSTSASRSRR